MSNLLSIPYKKADFIEIKHATRAYISNHSGAHPEEFRDDINSWEELRKNAVYDTVHENRVDAMLLYHAQLISVLAKLPMDIGLPIAYAPAFDPSAVPISLNNLIFERAALLFNLAALYSQLATTEDRSSVEGIKRAASNYQQAAGTLSILWSSVLPEFVASCRADEMPVELSNDFVKGLEWLMLAQAQECSWQLAKLSQYRNTLIAKISAGTSWFYQTAVDVIRNSIPSLVSAFPHDWIAHMEAKAHHFSAVSEYRESIVEYEASRYGVELARLTKALAEAKKAYNVAYKGRVAPTVVQDAQSLLETITASEARAQRDNDLVYHQDVPPVSSIVGIQVTKLVSPTVLKSLVNPAGVLQNRRPLFNNLISWGTLEAINIYNDRRKILIDDKVAAPSRQLQAETNEMLRKLHLPSSLEVLERPVGLPPSLLRKAEEVRLERGPTKIEASLADVERLGHHNLAILEEALDILDNEASEDEAARKDFPLTRPSSHEANAELIEKASRYRNILEEASKSDELIRQKWDEWEESIAELTLDEATLEASVPSSTLSSLVTQQSKQTRQNAQELRMKLEELDTLHRDCDQLVHRAQSHLAADDIRPRILKMASGFEQLASVTPAMFEDVLDEELVKFDKYLSEIMGMKRKHEDLLNGIQARNKEFLKSRREDPAVKERERALQLLDLAYLKYREITKNLGEGFDFYNDLADILVQFREVCKQWRLHRNQELRELTRSMQSLSLHLEEQTDPLDTTVATDSREIPRERLKLPALDSSEWDFEELSLPPPPQRQNTK